MKRRSTLWVTSTLGLAAVTAWFAALATVGASGATDAKTVRIAYFNPIAANAVTAATYKGIRASAKRMNAKVTMFDAGFDQNKQISQMQDALLSKQYDAFIVMPVNGAVLVKPTKDALAAGIKVVADWNNIGPDLGSIKPQIPGVSVVAQSLGAEGRLLGQQIVRACKGINPCTTVYMPGSFKQATEKLRLDAAHNVVKKAPNIVWKTSAEGGYTSDGGLKAATDTILALPDVNVFATPADQMAVGIVQAVKNAGKTGKIKVIGSATTIEGVAAVRKGLIFADPVLLPYSQGEMSAKIAINMVRGIKVPASVDSFKLSPIGPVATQATLNTPAGKAFKGQYHG